MIVDDSGVMRKNIRTILERGNHDVVMEVSDGREVLQNYIYYNPDIVTMDISMPGMDGIEALQGLLKVFPGAKVIMISAMGQKAQVLEAIRYGAKSYLVKPIEAQKLLSTVTNVINLDH
ncbi:response regulator [Cohnella faecalis]|uniref:Response regulator n=2 Tax=Cohnella faecalis TaxID=2315694 RepID=A0A398CLG5_9BACL|nr:response regulator [Cohnella faecalis]